MTLTWGDPVNKKSQTRFFREHTILLREMHAVRMPVMMPDSAVLGNMARFDPGYSASSSSSMASAAKEENSSFLVSVSASVDIPEADIAAGWVRVCTLLSL